MRRVHPRAVAYLAATCVSLVLLASPFVAYGASASVSIRNFAFQPPNVTIGSGESVTWTNLDQTAHTATSTTGAFDTGVLQPNQSRSVVFTSAGVFNYVCFIHGASMSGSVTVLAAATATPAPVPTPTPTPVRTPSLAPTPTPQATTARPAIPTAVPLPSPATPTPSPSPSPTPSASANVVAPVTAASPAPVSAIAAAPDDVEAGPGPIIAIAAVIAVTGLGMLALVLARRGIS